MSQSLNTGNLFLEEFIKRIIIKSRVQPKIEKRAVLLEKLEEVISAPPRLEIKPEIKPKEIIKQPLQVQPAKITQKTPVRPITQMPQIQKITIMDRLNRIFADPNVQVLNCPGPNKNIFITRLGMVQASQTAFTEDEIKNFVRELSEKTRIPLIPGLIKVIYQNFLITAVVSEFVGTNFIVERRQQILQGPLRVPAKVQFR